MRSLLERQQAFGAALTNDDLASSAEFLAGFADTPERSRRRFAAYQRNVRGNWRMALRAGYPVLATLIGKARFGALADQYLSRRPSGDADLNRFGADLAALLADHALTAELPCLPDLARLEWALEVVYGAAADGTPDLAALATIAPEQQGDVLLDLARSSALEIRTPWPVSEIWAAHQQVDPRRRDAALAAISPQPVDHLVLVSRSPSGGTSVRRLTPGEAAFRAACLAGCPLAMGLQQALATEPALDVASLLPNWLARGWISGIRLPAGVV